MKKALEEQTDMIILCEAIYWLINSLIDISGSRKLLLYLSQILRKNLEKLNACFWGRIHFFFFLLCLSLLLRKEVLGFLFFSFIFISFYVTKLFLEKPFSKNLLRSFSAQFIKRKFEHPDLHQLAFMVILKNPFFLRKTQCRPSQFPREVLSNPDYNTACPYSQFVWYVFCHIRTE